MLLSNLNLLATAPGGVMRLRELILTLAVQGKLVPQDPSDEPARELLKKIRAEKDRLIAAGKIKRDKPLAEIEEDEKPFALPKGWEWVRLGDIGYTNIGLTYSPNNVSDTGTPVLRSNNVQLGKLDLSDLKRVKMKIKDSVLVADGDLLICARNGSKALVGKTALICGLSEPMAFGAFMAIFRSEVNGYVLHFINAPLFRRMISDVNTTTINQITQENLKSTAFPLPPLAEQSRIVTRVEELMCLCDALDAKGQLEATQHAQLVSTLLGTLAESETPEQLADNWYRIASHFDMLLDRPQAVDALEQTILQLAVRGLLVPQNPQDEPASALLKKIRAEKDRLIAQGKIKRDKPLLPIAEDEQPFALPQGWKFVRLIDLMPEFQNGASSRGDADGQSITVLRLADIKGKRISLAATRQIPIAVADIQKYQLIEGDILITRVNGSADIVGQFNLCNQTIDAIYCDHFIRMRIDRHWIAPDFFALLGESELIRNSIKNLFITTAGQKTVNQGHIGSLQFGLPPLAEQSRIVTRVAQLRRLCSDLRARLSASQSTQAHLAEALIAI